jgi:16S rRNA (adenine1518-N6/adenine1519-N6)-dimethyltransferase
MVDRVRAKKYLGQHFLHHQATVKRIVGLLEAVDEAIVLEVGPGMGVLTRHLLERFDERLWVVEIDSESVEYLKRELPALAPRVLSGDFLKMDLRSLGDKPLVVIGNFPYNISSQILFHLLDYREVVTEVVGMFQREVARRLVALPGNRDYGILSVLIDFYFTRSYQWTVPEHYFKPPPRVKSAVVRFTRKPDSIGSEDYSHLVMRP